MYPRIGDYGLIGDLHSCALVSKDASIDWCCLPHFDSPSIFARMLDDSKGGSFLIRPTGHYTSTQQYRKDTAVLETTFISKGASFLVTDFMPVLLARDGQSHVIVRIVRGIRKKSSVTVTYDPRPNYAATREPLQRNSNGSITLKWGEGIFECYSSQGIPRLSASREFTFTLASNETRVFIFRYREANAKLLSAFNEESLLDETLRFWHSWVAKGQYAKGYRDELVRSAITLKLMQYRSEGSIIAAPTTSLPESIGGERNWDYRYSWMRDGTFTLYAFYVLGYDQEARDFFHFIEQSLHQEKGGLRHFYTIHGGRVPKEQSLTHLKGYENSRPVRIGNNAITQTQNDTYGSIIDAYYFMNKKGVAITSHTSDDIVRLVSNIERAWRSRDQSFWEVRSGQRHFTYTKVLSWVGMDRAIRLASNLHKVRKSHVGSWKRLRAEIYTDVWKNAWDKKRKVFKRSYDENGLDSTNLLFPLLQFMDKYDDDTKSMVMQTWNEFKTSEDDALLYRYIAKDGLKGGEGAFLLCSFWLVSSLALIGEVKTAKRILKKLMKYSNHLGLFSEEVDPKTGALLGNFPQAFSHVGFIMAVFYVTKYEKKYNKK